MTIYDLSLPLHAATLAWPGDTRFRSTPTARLAQDGANVSRLELSSHTGTHVDAPAHFLPAGRGVDRIPLGDLIGPARVVRIPSTCRRIETRHLQRLRIRKGERVLFKTANSQKRRAVAQRFPKEYVALTPEGAQWLARRGVRLVGTDFLGIERRGATGHPVHTALLRAGIALVEGLDLRTIPTGGYELVVLPLNVVGGDGAPARAVLIKR